MDNLIKITNNKKNPLLPAIRFYDKMQTYSTLFFSVIPAVKLEKTCAVIAPKICSKLYKLDILKESIRDLKFNFTTFIIAAE
ncbi:MAG: hypothetical protein UV34_C0032G0006 [Parcubacteria group bacterium GW2011_GWB1_42_6]|nr:MAG: hypothetical protein UV34_C0032G0006 [Parcubacteria group bacterium GW2011_GWB1_42_6]